MLVWMALLRGEPVREEPLDQTESHQLQSFWLLKSLHCRYLY